MSAYEVTACTLVDYISQVDPVRRGDERCGREGLDAAARGGRGRQEGSRADLTPLRRGHRPQVGVFAVIICYFGIRIL